MAAYFAMTGGCVSAAALFRQVFPPNLHAALPSLSVLIPYGMLLLLTAWHMSRLRTGGRVFGTLLAVPGLLGFPFGTLLFGYFIWVLQGAQGRKVFSEEYRQAVAVTPQLRFGVSAFTKVTLALLFMGLFLAAAVFVLMSR